MPPNLFPTVTSPIAEALYSALVPWLIHAVVGVVPALIIAFLGRHRVSWRKWEAFAFLLPFGTWFFLTSCFQQINPWKGLGNLILEPSCIGLAILFAALLRVALGRQCDETRLAVGLLTALCLLAALVYYLLPEI